MDKILVLGNDVRITEDDYISLTDIAKKKNPQDPKDVVKNWMRTKFCIEFLGLWEQLHNQNFRWVEYDPLYQEAGKNYFTMSPTKWIETTGAIGIKLKLGKNAGTFAHKDIAMEFASWISAEFKLYLIKEFQRLKEEESKNKSLEWNVKRTLTKINYRIHTDAVKENLIPPKISPNQIKQIYANEGDVLNLALFGKTAQEWRSLNPDKKGNMRDYSDISQLVCLANLENLNAVFISEGLEQSQRLVKLNEIARSQMKLLTQDKDIKKLSSK